MPIVKNNIAARSDASDPAYPIHDGIPANALKLKDGAEEVFGFLPGLAPAPKRMPIREKPSASLGSAHVVFGDSITHCANWPAPTVIVSDGPYGLHSYPGDPWTPDGLADCYEPHLRRWHDLALPSCTLWFWNSEQGWANCHRMIEECGWEFRNCHIWDKGLAHVAGNVNTRTIHCELGVGNVRHEPAVRGGERLKNGTAALHMNQKPLSILEQAIRSTSDPGDIVWEPFGGLCSTSVAAIRTGRHAYAAEINPEYYMAATRRIRDEEPSIPIASAV